MEKVIGKKVWLFHEVKYSTELDKSKTFEVIKVKEPEDCGDCCQHYVVKDNEGNEQEVREWMVVFIPEIINNQINISKYLSDNRCYAEVVSEYTSFVKVSISWGDWKHDHLWCTNLMGFIGYKEIDEEVTEDNGSDCYSADHTYASVEKLVI